MIEVTPQEFDFIRASIKSAYPTFNVMPDQYSIDRVVAQMCYIQLSLLGCAGWVAVANTISNPVCGDPLMPVEKPGQEFWYTPFYFRGEWNCRRQIQIFKEMCGSWITPIEERNPGKITFYFDFEKGDYKCQNS